MTHNRNQELLNHCFYDAHTTYREIQLEDGYLVEPEDIPAIALAQNLLQSCMLRFLISRLEIQCAIEDKTLLEPILSEVIKGLKPRQYLAPEMQKRHVSEEYAFYLILESSMNTHMFLFPQHEREQEITTLYILINTMLSYKFFHKKISMH